MPGMATGLPRSKPITTKKEMGLIRTLNAGSGFDIWIFIFELTLLLVHDILFLVAKIKSWEAKTYAVVAELADAHGSGPCGLTPVEVRVLSTASYVI